MNFLASIRLHKKAILTGISIAGIVSYYNYNRHMYERELFNRMNEVIQGKVKLSGVYLQQRQAFSWLWYVQWLLPYHQSLKIVNPLTGEMIRHIGLNHAKNGGFLTSSFGSHTNLEYNYLNRFESSIPIECWVDYYHQMGHYPENIDVSMLNRITATEDESPNAYKTQFGSFIKLPNGSTTFSSCQSAIMRAIMIEELVRKGGIKEEDIHRW